MRRILISFASLFFALICQGQSATDLLTSYNNLTQEEYSKERIVDQKELGLEVYSALSIDRGINHISTREFFFDYIKLLLRFSRYQDRSGLNVIDSLLRDFYHHRNTDQEPINLDSYGYLVLSSNNDGSKDFLHVLTNIIGQEYEGISSSFYVDSIVHELSQFYRKERSKELGPNHPLYHTEQLVILNMLTAASKRGAVYLDKLIVEIQNDLRDANYSNTQNIPTRSIPVISYLLNYYIRNDLFFQANDLIAQITNQHRDLVPDKVKQPSPFNIIPRNVNDSFWRHHLFLNYPEIFSYIQESRLFVEAVVYSNILRHEGSLNNHYIVAKSYFETRNYEALIKYFNLEIEGNTSLRKYKRNEKLWVQYAPKIIPDDIIVYPLVINGAFHTNDSSLARRLLHEFIFYQASKIKEKGEPSIYSDPDIGVYTLSRETSLQGIESRYLWLVSQADNALSTGQLNYGKYLIYELNEVLDLIPDLVSKLPFSEYSDYYIDHNIIVNRLRKTLLMLELRIDFSAGNYKEFNEKIELTGQSDEEDSDRSLLRSRRTNSLSPPVYWSEFMKAIELQDASAFFEADEAYMNTLWKLVAEYLSKLNSADINERDQIAKFYSPHFFNYLEFAATVLGVHPSKSKPANYNYIHPSFEAYNLILRTKGSVFTHELSVKNRIMSSNDPLLVNDFIRWENIGKEISDLESQSPLSKNKKEKLQQLRLLESKVFQALTKQSSSFETPEKPVKWKDVRDNLEEDEISVEVVRVPTTGDQIHYYYFILYKGINNPLIVIDEKGKELESRHLKYYRNSIRLKTLDEESYNAFFSKIDQVRLSVGRNINTIYLSGDGVFNSININTLFNRATGKYIEEYLDIRLLTNTRDLVSGQREKMDIGQAVLIGNPDFHNATETTSSQLISQTRGIPDLDNPAPLPGAEEEVKVISRMLEPTYNVITMLGNEATEQRLKSIQKPGLLHFATHGFFANYEGSSRPFGGILLSGASTDTQSDEDGILTSFEAQGLNLKNTNLVVLSACETGLSGSTYSGGVQGLQRAFLLAGAKNVIMSLWKVDDKATSKLMSEFYKNISTSGIREAFKLAKDKTRMEYPDPYYWGAFVLIR